MSDFTDTRTVVARKEHTCDWCLTLIRPKEAYTRITGVGDGDFFSVPYHPDCNGARHEATPPGEYVCTDRHDRGGDCDH